MGTWHETAVLCDWHVNEAHYLETWGDCRGYDGTATIQQPLIAPLYGGKSALDRMLAGQVSDLYVVRQYLDAQRGGWA